MTQRPSSPLLPPPPFCAQDEVAEETAKPKWVKNTTHPLWVLREQPPTTFVAAMRAQVSVWHVAVVGLPGVCVLMRGTWWRGLMANAVPFVVEFTKI